MTSRRTVSTFGMIVLFVLLVGVPVALAQGNGHAYGHTKNRPGAAAQPSAAGAPELQAAPGISTLSFGSWLDDASLIPRGGGTMSVAFSYWRTPLYHEVDVPVIDGGVGIAPRVQVNFSVPYYHASDSDGTVVRGLGDVYLSTKIQLKDPSTATRIGLALTPLVEVLTYAPRPDTSRVSWAIPVSMELRRDRWRTFGSAGYFSRGALFASGAIEISMTNRTAVTGSISRSHSIRRDETSAALGLGQSRTDVSGALSVALNQTVSAFGAVARTISKQDANSSTLAVTGGIAFAFDAWGKGAAQ